MHCKQLKKYWNKIPFPDGITLVEAVEIIERYIEMEGEKWNLKRQVSKM